MFNSIQCWSTLSDDPHLEWNIRSGLGYDIAPTPSATATPAAQPVSNSAARFGGGGDLPAQGGFGLTVWKGGSTEDIAAAAAAGGCLLAAVWATSPDGEFIYFIYGAPTVVNQAWLARFPGGEVPAGTAVLVECGGATVSALSSDTDEGGAGGERPHGWLVTRLLVVLFLLLPFLLVAAGVQRVWRRIRTGLGGRR